MIDCFRFGLVYWIDRRVLDGVIKPCLQQARHVLHWSVCSLVEWLFDWLIGFVRLLAS